MKTGGCSHLPFVQTSNPGRTVIDGVKIVFTCLMMEKILLSLGINICERKIDGSGVIKWSKAKYRHLVFTIYPAGRVVIDGSLHKYWKDENYSDFSFTELRECIYDLILSFQIPLTAEIQNIEFGVNITTPFNPFEFCENVIAYWDGKKEFKPMDECSPVIGFECNRYEYCIKVYDKGLQNKKAVNILRFEQATTRMRAIAAAGIRTLLDLTERVKFEKLGVILNKTFSDLIISDSVIVTDLSKRDLAIYNRGEKPKQWGKMERWERVRFKAEFRRIIDCL